MDSQSQQKQQHSRPTTTTTLDPIITLQVPMDSSSRSVVSSDDQEISGGSRSSVSSVCFLPLNSSGCNHDGCGWSSSQSSSDGSDDDDDDGNEIADSFQCRVLLKNERCHDDDDGVTAVARNVAASLSLSGRKLASCHLNGDAFVWDLGRRRIVHELYCCSNDDERPGRGMALRRLGGTGCTTTTNILYQTRGVHGATVSIHDAETFQVVTKFETNSFSYCTAAPCHGNRSILVLPTANMYVAQVRDIRVSPQSPPIVRFHGAAGLGIEEDDEEKHGMLTSVAMSEPWMGEDDGCESDGRPVVACGMESGTVFFHDIRMPTTSSSDGDASKGSRLISSHIKLGKHPVLGLDLAPSSASKPGNERSFVSIAGTGADAADLSELPVKDRGTVAAIKASFGDSDACEPTASARLRARVSTCQVSGLNEPARGGRPGVNVCRFRPDERIFCVGGWDRRVRIFDRTGNAAPLAILKGHDDSIAALDWSPDSQTTGLLASGAGDGRINIWRCFPSSNVLGAYKIL